MITRNEFIEGLVSGILKPSDIYLEIKDRFPKTPRCSKLLTKNGPPRWCSLAPDHQGKCE